MPKLATPRDAEELEEFLLDADRVKELDSPQALKSFITRYRDVANEHDPELQHQAKEQREQVLKEFLDAHGYEPKDKSTKRLPFTHSGVNKGQWHNPAAPGAHLDGQFSHFGSFLKAVWDYYEPSIAEKDPRLLKTLGEAQGSQGGFLVPEEFRAQLMKLALEVAIVRPRATVLPMTRERLRVPTIRDTSHATNVYGGVQAYWTPESGAITGSSNEPTFGQVVLTAQKLAALTRAGNELVEDAAAGLEAFLLQIFREALTYFEDDAFISGVGAGQPVGILNAPCLVTVAKETGQAATTIVWENVVKMFSRMLPSSLGRAVWVAHLDTVVELATMSLAVGTGGSPMWVQNGQGAMPTTILGRPVIFTEKAQTLGTAGDIYFVDLSQYLIGDRQSITVGQSEHSRFANDETEWKFISRVTGRPWMDSAVTPRNGSNTLSPIVNLAARS